MRDIVAAESVGVPAVVAVIGWLESIARETRGAAGMRELPIVAVQENFHGRSREEIAAAARPYAPKIVGAITSVAGRQRE